MSGKSRKSKQKSGQGRSYPSWIFAVGATLLAVIVIIVMSGQADAARNQPRDESLAEGVAFTDLEAQMMEFVRFYEEDIALTPEQAAIKVEVLESIPAVCCSDNSALTCCCPCNLSKATWGLTHYLLSQKNFDADQLRVAVTDWLAFSNPNGFSGDACYTGGCERPSHRNGCSGMKDVVI